MRSAGSAGPKHIDSLKFFAPLKTGGNLRFCGKKACMRPIFRRCVSLTISGEEGIITSKAF